VSGSSSMRSTTPFFFSFCFFMAASLSAYFLVGCSYCSDSLGIS
jgi:hypothetical protein